MVRSAGLTLRTILPSPSACRRHGPVMRITTAPVIITVLLYTIILYILDLGIYLYTGMDIKGQCLACPASKCIVILPFGREGRGGGRMAGPNAQKLVATDG